MINFRKLLFYTKDRLSGGRVMLHLKDIHQLVTDPESLYSKEKISARKNRLLKHALQNVPYYKNVGLHGAEIALSSFPVINKNIIRDNLKAFLSNGAEVGKLLKVVTSGSTGTPFTTFQDQHKKLRNTADTIYFSKLAGFDIGTPLNYLKVWNKVNRKNIVRSWFENIVPIDVTQMSDTEITRLVARFDSNTSQQSFLGYASALESICRYLEKQPVAQKIKNVKAVIAMSEGLSDYAKDAVFKYFGVHAVSRYSNVENGILAQQLANGTNTFIINRASYCIEILEMHSDAPVPMGQTGRIVVTDYFNLAMPIIRYDTGDIGAFDYLEDTKKIVLSKVEGRKMDLVFNTLGNLVSSFTLTNNMWLYPEVTQYQFIQTGKKQYLFKLNVVDIFEREDMLISEFKRYFGQDAEIKVEYVKEIPLLNSGKRKKVMNISE